jgi:hypothetical protein
MMTSPRRPCLFCFNSRNSIGVVEELSAYDNHEIAEQDNAVSPFTDSQLPLWFAVVAVSSGASFCDCERVSLLPIVDRKDAANAHAKWIHDCLVFIESAAPTRTRAGT